MKCRCQPVRSPALTAAWLRLLVFFVVLAAAGRVWSVGAEREYLTDVWTADNGLPDSSVTAIAQTPDGFLWVGTYNGLARFDGIRFEVFDPANTPALAHARVRKLSVDDQGTLWINTMDGSMTSLRRGGFAREWTGAEGSDPDASLVLARSNQVTFILHSGALRRNRQNALPGVGWQELNPPSRGAGMVCVADGAGTIWFRGGDRQLWQLTETNFYPVSADSGLPEDAVNALTTDSAGRLWVGTETNIAWWDGTQFQLASPTNFGPVNPMFIAPASDGGVWVVTEKRVRKLLGRRWVLEAEPLRNVYTSTLTRMGAIPEHDGGVWLYDYGRGLAHISGDGKVHQFGPPDGFPGQRVNCVFPDREGNLWAGLDAAGLVRLRERRFQTRDTSVSQPAMPTRSVQGETNGTVWIGTLGDGLARLQDGKLTNFNLPGGSGGGFVFCVCPDAAGRLWVSAGDEDLFVGENGQFKQVTPNVHGVKAIFADKLGRVWAGTKTGLFVSTPTSPETFVLFEPLTRNPVRALAEDGSGNIWAGAEDGTLFCIGTNNVANAFTSVENAAPHAIWSLLTEGDTVWVGTFRGGLLQFRDGKFTRFSDNEGLPDNIICQILPDDAGNLWLGSHQGIFRVAKSALAAFARGEIKTIPTLVFGRSDGLPSLECSGGYQPADWRAPDGRLWFTTIKGVVSVKPEQIQPNLLAPPVVIEDILINGKKLTAAPKGTIYDAAKNYLELPPGKHEVEFQYAGLSLVSSDRVQFRYQLQGADADWVDAGTRRFVQYNLLPPNVYHFTVIAANGDGIWNNTGAMLTLKILPFYYQTMWFRLLAWGLASALAAGVVWVSLTRRMQQKMELFERQQAVERERARIAKDIHDDLGANLTLIAVLGDLAKKEKAGERIEKMASTARQAVKSLDEIVWAVNPRNDTLAHLIDYTGQFAVDYLRSAGVRCLLDVPEQTPAREVPTNVRHNVFLVVKEALQNIVKHARATEVWLRIRATGQGLRIVVEDNGSGFERAPENAVADGLRNMKQRMSEIGGECRIQSRVGAGTEIIVELPSSAG